jgi:hypothetical protein
VDGPIHTLDPTNGIEMIKGRIFSVLSSTMYKQLHQIKHPLDRSSSSVAVSVTVAKESVHA